MLRKIISAALCLVLLSGICALAETFYPGNVASTSYTETQWLTNDNSCALLVCMAAADYCEAEGVSKSQLLSLLVSEKTYICENDGLSVYIPDGDTCLRISIRFDGAAESASASQCSPEDIGSGGDWYTVRPESCAVILSN